MVLSRNSSINLECNNELADDSSSLEGIEFEVEKPVFKKPSEAKDSSSCRKYAGKRTLLELYLIIVCFVFFLTFTFTVGILAHLEVKALTDIKPGFKFTYKKEESKTLNFLYFTITNGDKGFRVEPYSKASDKGFNGLLNTKTEVHTFSTSCPLEDNRVTCTTAECESEGGRILSSMDFTADPCNDFYQFSCGSFMKYRSQSETTDMDRFSLIRDHTLSLTRKLLEKPIDQTEPKFVLKLKKFYKSCLNKPSHWSIMGLVSDLLAKTNLPPWPATEDNESVTTKLSIEYTLATVRIYGGGAPVFLLNKIGLNNKVILELSFGESLFSNVFSARKRYLSPSYERNKLESLLIYLFVNLQIPPEKASEEATKLVRFAKSLDHLTRRRTSELKFPKISAKTISELEAICPEFQWTKYINYLNENLEFTDHLRADTQIIINHIEHTIDICKLLESTNVSTVYNYIVWNLIGAYIPYFDNYILNEMNKLSNYRRFWNAGNKRWKNCLALVSHSQVAPALDYLVIKYRNTSYTLEEVTVLVEELISVFKDSVSNLKWLGEKAKALAKLEIEKINYVVGYENISMDEVQLNIMFAKINFNDVFLDNVLAEARLSFPSSFFFRNSPSTNSFASNPLEPTPNFNFATRSLFIPAGIIQPPFFLPGLPRYLTYGGIGSVISHEIVHSLWKLGQIFQEKANNTEGELMEAVRNVNKKKLCFSRQYSQFPLGKDGAKVNGMRTLEENIADNGGIVQVFRAFEKILEQAEEKKLPRLTFTNHQMFFIQYAQMFCEIVEDPKRSYTYENHAMKKYRVLGPLQNYPRFSEAFGCQQNSPMNPNDKCQLWG